MFKFCKPGGVLGYKVLSDSDSRFCMKKLLHRTLSCRLLKALIGGQTPERERASSGDVINSFGILTSRYAVLGQYFSHRGLLGGPSSLERGYMHMDCETIKMQYLNIANSQPNF
jgi:hypothetical protein